MQGRIENENKINAKIMNKLKMMPLYVTEWYYNMKASGTEITSCRDYINKLFLFLSYINEDVKSVEPSDITSAATEMYFDKIKMKTVIRNGEETYVYTSDSYKQCVWSCLKKFMDFMVNKGYMETNYVTHIARSKNKDLYRINQTRVHLTEDDFNNILSSVAHGCGSSRAITKQEKYRNRDMAIMLLFMTTGMRRTALSEINISDINFATGKLEIIDKGKIPHRYILSNRVLNCIQDWLEDRKELNNSNKDALFINYKGERLSGKAIYDIVEKYSIDALGYKISPHKLRSGFCSIMYDKTGGNIEFVRRAVGHANVSTTQRYITTDNNECERAGAIITNLLSF